MLQMKESSWVRLTWQNLGRVILVACLPELPKSTSSVIHRSESYSGWYFGLTEGKKRHLVCYISIRAYVAMFFYLCGRKYAQSR